MLTFKGRYLCYNDKEIAFVDVLDYLRGTEKYVVRLTSVCDRVPAAELKELISAANEMKPTTIAESAVIELLKKRLEEKLHECLLATDFMYRLTFELRECREHSRVLQSSLDEMRKKRWDLERELSDLKNKLQSLKETESEAESENETD